MRWRPLIMCTPRHNRSNPRPPLMRRAGIAVSFVLAAYCVGTAPAFAQADAFRVHAAASLKEAIDDLASRYEAEQGVDVTPIYAASGTLARQIANRAPADVFVSAHPRWLNWLREEGVELVNSEVVAGNRLALIAHRNAPKTPADAMDRLATASAHDKRIAIGHPDYVPAGLYARQALKALGHWRNLRPRLARAFSARATVAMVARGGIALGLAYRTDAHSSKRVQSLGLLPLRTHDPIRYRAAVVEPAPDAASGFRQWLTSPAAQAILADHGLELAP